MVAITGANGLLGSFITRKFAAEKHPVVGIKRMSSNMDDVASFAHEVTWRNADVTNSLSLHDAFENVDTVIHAAAVVSFDPRAKQRIFETNVNGTRNVVNACLALGIPRLIFISSVAALGRKKGMTEVDEEHKWVDSPLNSDYAKSKYLAELEVFRGQEEGLSVSVINPSVILSTSDPTKSSAQIFNYVNKQRPFYVDGSMNYVDVRDVADMVYGLHRSPMPGEKFIASAGSVELRDLMAKIAQRLGKKEPSIRIHPALLQFGAWCEEWRCKLTGADAVISRQSVKMPGEKFVYRNQKSIQRLQTAYRPLDETLDWCCDYYRSAFTTNKQK